VRVDRNVSGGDNRVTSNRKAFAMLITIDNRTIELSDHQVDSFHALTRLQQGVALGVLEGLSQREAYRRAGGGAKTQNAADRSVSQIVNNRMVQEFIESFKVEQVESLGKVLIDRERIIAMLAEQATCDIGLQDLNKPENFKHVSEVIIDPTGEVRYKFTGPADRRAAAKQLAEMLGWNKPTELKISGELTTRARLDDFYGSNS
jgi:phage terminase small subunit